MWGFQQAVVIFMFSRIYVCVSVRVTPPDQMKNDRDQKFGLHSRLEALEKKKFYSFKFWIFKGLFTPKNVEKWPKKP